MENKQIAKIFYEISDFLEMENETYRAFAYERAGLTLDSMEEDIGKIYRKGGKKALRDIPGIGESIAEKIEEYLLKGEIAFHQRLKKKMPIDLEGLVQVEGMGPKRVKVLYQKLGIKNLEDLEKAARQGKIAPLFGFGPKTEQNILEGIEFLKRSKGRFLLGEVLPLAEQIEEALKSLKEVKNVSVAGSLRRRKETIGDIDFLVTLKNKRSAPKVMDFFVNLPGVVKVWGKGSTRSSIRLETGVDVDLRVVPAKCYGAALQYFTGSKEHNIETRKVAINKGLKLNEYGLFRGKRMIAGKTEQEIYKALGMQWIPPEIRQDEGEVEASLKGKLPKLIDLKDIKGDLHAHSNWDGGMNSIWEMVNTAIALGYRYLGISDHTKFLRIENGLDEKGLAEQRKEIDKINKRLARTKIKFKVLQGAETNILKNGSIDINDQALKKLDYAIAGIHSHFKMEKREMTERIIKAMKNPYIKIISHPTGRILRRRDEYRVDFEKILRAAKEFGVIMEINASPYRLDLNDKKIRTAKEMGVKMIINTDSHQTNQLKLMELGVAQARRGWAEKKDIVNTKNLKGLLKEIGHEDK
jgi:DNA polymerase (family 10)